MNFLEECVEDSLAIWETCLDTDFIKGMEMENLKEDCFKGYIVEDSLYLREYAKVFGYGIINSNNVEEIRNFYSLLAFINENEGSTRIKYLKRYNLTDSDIQSLPLRPENRLYVDTMINAVRDGGAANVMMASMPCMLSYRWIFAKLVEKNKNVLNMWYGDFIKDYMGSSYNEVITKWSEFTNEICQDLSLEEKNRLKIIFRECSKREYDFWVMSGKPRTDI